MHLIQKGWPSRSCHFFRTLNCCFLCGHQNGLTSHSGAQLSQADQRLFLAFIVIDMTCGFVLGPQMCHSLYKIVGCVCVPMATAQVTGGESFIAFGHTRGSQRIQCLGDGLKILKGMCFLWLQLIFLADNQKGHSNKIYKGRKWLLKNTGTLAWRTTVSPEEVLQIKFCQFFSQNTNTLQNCSAFSLIVMHVAFATVQWEYLRIFPQESCAEQISFPSPLKKDGLEKAGPLQHFPGSVKILPTIWSTQNSCRPLNFFFIPAI